MTRILGFFVGGIYLIYGLLGSINPRWGFQLWESTLGQIYPGPTRGIAKQYSKLSLPALRYFSYWILAGAGIMLWLAGRTRD